MTGTFSWLHKHPLMKQVSSGTRWQSQILDKTPCTNGAKVKKQGNALSKQSTNPLL
jgi:hypothetical protein